MAPPPLLSPLGFCWVTLLWGNSPHGQKEKEERERPFAIVGEKYSTLLCWWDNGIITYWPLFWHVQIKPGKAEPTAGSVGSGEYPIVWWKRSESGGRGKWRRGTRKKRGGCRESVSLVLERGGIETLTSWEPSLKLSGKVESGGVRDCVLGLNWMAFWLSWRSKTPASLQLLGTVTEKPCEGPSVLTDW